MLILPIKKKWFDMIISGQKKEEYRELKPYYRKRFHTIGLLDDYGLPVPGTQKIVLRNGYSNDSPSVVVHCSIDIKPGKAEWGAELGKDYYVLKIEKIEKYEGYED